ncbi:MAG: hypothetical protein GTO60_04240, partial [Gammaproteobacteria bacterium]|nr:hypothetical protein [Gammaproteobacteria bacterium]
NADNLGVIDPENEDPFYGHIGNPDDCWGCHGYLSASAAPGTGPIAPDISSSDISVVTAGHDTSVTLTGSAFTNLDDGFEWISSVTLTASDGSTIELTPDNISHDLIMLTIPGVLVTGNYHLRAVKGPSGSNPTVVSVKPDVSIMDVDCNKKRGLLTITGSGFSEKVEGTDAYINVEVNGITVDIISWTDTKIKASVSRCSNKNSVTVNTLFGSITSSNGKPPKPCKGKGCQK